MASVMGEFYGVYGNSRPRHLGSVVVGCGGHVPLPLGLLELGFSYLKNPGSPVRRGYEDPEDPIGPTRIMVDQGTVLEEDTVWSWSKYIWM